MIALISANWLFALLALLIGIATAYWVWAATHKNDDETLGFDADDGLLDKAGEAVPTASELDQALPVEASVEQDIGTTAAVSAAAVAAPIVEPKPRARKHPVATEKAAPAPAGKPKIAPASGEPDNLRLVKGIGPKLNNLLNGLGITRFDQIAAWGAEEISEVDQYLGNFSGRVTRDSWIDQAKYLAEDDIAGFEKKYGNL